MLTGVALGIYRDLYEAKEYFVKENKTFYPDRRRAGIYKRYYSAYKNIYGAVRPITEDINHVSNFKNDIKAR